LAFTTAFDQPPPFQELLEPSIKNSDDKGGEKDKGKDGAKDTSAGRNLGIENSGLVGMGIALLTCIAGVGLL
jgi:hypothetical protein